MATRPRKTVGSKGPAIGDLSPMLLDERKAAPVDQSEYIAEIKYDGYRILAEFGEGHCILKTKNGADCTKWFPEVASGLAALSCGRTVVDGEMTILDELGRTDFNALHDRARRRRWQEGDKLVTFCVFDLLVQNGVSIMDRPLVERKALLAELVEPAPPNVLYARYIDATTDDLPVTWLYEHALSLKLEGIVGKLAQSKYRPGVRTTDWFKLKRPGAVPPERFHRKK